MQVNLRYQLPNLAPLMHLGSQRLCPGLDKAQTELCPYIKDLYYLGCNSECNSHFQNRFLDHRALAQQKMAAKGIHRALDHQRQAGHQALAHQWQTVHWVPDHQKQAGHQAPDTQRQAGHWALDLKRQDGHGVVDQQAGHQALNHQRQVCTGHQNIRLGMRLRISEVRLGIRHWPIKGRLSIGHRTI